MVIHLIYREMLPSEYAILKDFLYEAIFVPEGTTPPDRSIVELPELTLYYEGFGSGEADYCIVADDGGKVIGAAWSRIMNDYGHVDDETPSLAISLYKEYRGQGIGSQLMVEMLDLLKRQGYERASLAVQKANYAVKMYKNVGFKIVDENGEEYIMVCDVRGDACSEEEVNMRKNISTDTFEYDEFAEWLDSIFGTGVPSNVARIVFNIYEESDCRHYIEAMGYSSFVEGGNDRAHGECIDFGTRSNPYWMEKSSWDVVLITEEDLLSETECSLQKYLENGQCASKLRAVGSIAVRFEKGEPEMVWLRN